MSKQAYTFRLYPTKKQAQALQWTLDRARELYNAVLQERRDAYRMAGKSITYYDQANQLPEIKDIREEYKDIHAQVLQDVLRRVQKAFDHFFRRCKAGETPGFPRFQGRNRYESFCYPQAGYALTADHRVCLSKTPGTPAKSVAGVVRSRKRHSMNAGIRAHAVRSSTAITIPLSPFLPSDGGFRRRKLPEKPRGLSPGESSQHDILVASGCVDQCTKGDLLLSFCEDKHH
jgi:hypothetical protein